MLSRAKVRDEWAERLDRQGKTAALRSLARWARKAAQTHLVRPGSDADAYAAGILLVAEEALRRAKKLGKETR